MHFVSLAYPLFVVAVLGGYYALHHPGRLREQNLFLLAASYAFYAWFSWTYALTLAVATYVNFYAARRIHAGDEAARRKWIRIGVAFNVGVLCAFKYLGFFAESAAAILNVFGMDLSWSIEHVWLPLGISFFTFQNLGYLLDVYKRQTDPVDDPFDYALFIAFFPQLILGPIERAATLLPQIQAPRRPTPDSFQRGAWLIFLGFTKKIVVADPIGRMVEPLFPAHTAGDTYLSGHVLAGALLFMLQIYVDFASYTDIARGTGRLFGFEISRNFRTPYLAENLREFWARWHMTLSTWINDHVYTWLAVQPRLNTLLGTSGLLVVTMLIMGAWHGASWTFIGWGLYHGILLVAYHKSRPFLHRRAQFHTRTGHLVFKGISVALTFGLVTLGDVLFRANGIDQAMAMYRDLILQPGMQASTFATLLSGLRLYALVLALDILEYRTDDDEAILAWPWPARRLVQFGMAYLMIHSIAENSRTVGADFHYFQF